MRSMEDAVALGVSMVNAGNGAGVRTVGIVTRMDYPIGFMVNYFYPPFFFFFSTGHLMSVSGSKAKQTILLFF
jgi:hypothetical protein